MALNGLFTKELQVVNVGLELFYDDLQKAGCKAIQTQWTIPTSADPRIKALLDKFAEMDEK